MLVGVADLRAAADWWRDTYGLKHCVGGRHPTGTENLCIRVGNLCIRVGGAQYLELITVFDPSNPDASDWVHSSNRVAAWRRGRFVSTTRRRSRHASGVRSTMVGSIDPMEPQAVGRSESAGPARRRRVRAGVGLDRIGRRRRHHLPGSRLIASQRSDATPRRFTSRKHSPNTADTDVRHTAVPLGGRIRS